MNEEYMNLAIQLAKRGRGRTSPNPLVGALVVREGQIVGRGFHQKAGEPHAEIIAIKDAGRKARGGELYVTLEPCCHYGRTPPCTKAIIDAGIKKVVAGMEDPNKVVAGQGIFSLKEGGIDVHTGVLREKCEILNEVYIKFITQKKPFVILKSAASLNGKIATKPGNTQWITNEQSRRYVHKLRDQVDGILVGIGTILADDPQLTTRLEKKRGKDPVRIVIDSKLRTPLQARVFNPESQTGVIIATTKYADEKKIKKVEELGATVIVTSSENGTVDLEDLMLELGQREITSLLVEGGAKINAAFFSAAIVDKLFCFFAPKIIGEVNALSMVDTQGIKGLNDPIMLYNISVKRFGDDILIEGYVRK